MATRSFSGKVVLISGAAGGLGAALCRRFAQRGARIVALDLDAQRLQALLATLPEGALAIAGDIADAQFCSQALATTLAHFGALDTSAGFSDPAAAAALAAKLGASKGKGGAPLENAAVKAAIADAQARLNGSGRVLVRASGTEPLIRIMAEGDDEKLINQLVSDIASKVREAAA